MKKIYSIFFAAIVLTACSSSPKANNESEIGDPIVALEEVTEPTTDLNIDSLKKAVAEDIISWGAKDAYFDEDNFFIYCVDPQSLSAPANEVAKAMFPMVQEVPGVKGCIVMDYSTKKELGRYEK